jgi:hypothetical protein
LHVNSPTTDSLYIYIAASEPTSGRLRYKGRNGNWQNVDFTITDPAIVFTHRVHWLQYELQGINPSGGQASSNDQEQRVAENVFHVIADKEVSVYALNQGSTTSDAFFANANQIIIEFHHNIEGISKLDKIQNVIKRFLNLGYKIQVKEGDLINNDMFTILITKFG